MTITNRFFVLPDKNHPFRVGLSEKCSISSHRKSKLLYPFVHRLLTVPAQLLNYFFGIWDYPVFLILELTVNNQ